MSENEHLLEGHQIELTRNLAVGDHGLAQDPNTKTSRPW